MAAGLVVATTPFILRLPVLLACDVLLPVSPMSVLLLVLWLVHRVHLLEGVAIVRKVGDVVIFGTVHVPWRVLLYVPSLAVAHGTVCSV